MLKSDFSRFFSECCDGLNHCTFQEFGLYVHVCYRSKIVYFEVPKNACTFIKAVLHKIESRCADFEHETFNSVHERSFSPLLTPFQCPDFRKFIYRPDVFCFTVFRDPLERLLSAYLDKVLSGNVGLGFIESAVGKRDASEVGFEDFVYSVSLQKVSEMNAHWRIQKYMSFINTFDCIVPYSFNNIQGLALDICAHAGLDSKEYTAFRMDLAPHRTNSAEKLAEYWSSSIEGIVRAKFREDYEVIDKLIRPMHDSARAAAEQETNIVARHSQPVSTKATGLHSGRRSARANGSGRVKT